MCWSRPMDLLTPDVTSDHDFKDCASDVVQRTCRESVQRLIFSVLVFHLPINDGGLSHTKVYERGPLEPLINDANDLVLLPRDGSLRTELLSL